MNNIFRKIKSLIYSLPFGLKGADSEIMGSNVSGDGNDTTINQQVNDKRVAKHLLNGEITQEVEELRYRTYKATREAEKYQYVGHGMSVKKKESKKPIGIIKFSQENKQVCDDVLSELSRIDSYGVDKYIIKIDYNFPVRFKFQEFLKVVDVIIKDNEKALTTLRFDDISNPQAFNSKPFVSELEKLVELFNKNDSYGLNRTDFASSMVCMNFTTLRATDEEPDVVSYTFIQPELIDVKHDNGEFKLTYRWDEYRRIDLTDKFFNAELEEKYKNKEKKNVSIEATIDDSKNKYENIIKCSKCGKEMNTYFEGYIVDSETSEPVCLECYKKSLLKGMK